MVRSNPHLCARRQAACFRSEQEGVSPAVLHFVIAARAAGLDRKQARTSQHRQAGIKVRMNFHVRQVVIVEPGTPQTLVVQAKAQRLDQVERRTAVGAQPDDIAGIPGNLGFEQHDVKHLRPAPWLVLGRGALPVQQNQLGGIGKLEPQAPHLIDDAKIYRLLQIEHGIRRRLLHEVGELEMK